MTTKELLYIQDALSSEQLFQTKCSEAASQLQDPELRKCVEKMGQKHQELFSKFYQLI